MRIRDAERDDADYQCYARLVPELRTGDAVPSRERWDAELAARAIVLEDDRGEVLGIGIMDLLADVAYVRNVIVAPGHRRLGLGRAIMRVLSKRARDAGCASMRLNVRIDNDAALGLYRTLGLSHAFFSTALRFPWGAVDLLPRGACRAERSLDDRDDAALERDFDLAPSQLADARARPGQFVYVLRDDAGAATGLSRFVAAFPGAFPFITRDPADARALLEALASHRLPAHDATSLVIENAPSLLALLAPFGEIKLEMAHLRGPVPAGDD